MAPVNFTGVWTIAKSENMEGYLEEIGCGWMIPKMALAPALTLTITQDDNNIVITGTNVKGDSVEKFTVGKQFEQDMPPSGTKSKCTTKWEGEKLIFDAEPLDNKSKAQHIVRELINGEMVLSIQVGDVVCKRYFKKQ